MNAQSQTVLISSINELINENKLNGLKANQLGNFAKIVDKYNELMIKTNDVRTIEVESFLTKSCNELGNFNTKQLEEILNLTISYVVTKYCV